MSKKHTNIDNTSSSEHEHPRKGGRPKGAIGKDKIHLIARILRHERPIFAQLLRWIRSDDGQLSLAAIKLAWSYCYGKPPERLLIGNDQGKPFVVAAPQPVESFADWERLVKEAEGIASAHSDAGDRAES